MEIFSASEEIATYARISLNIMTLFIFFLLFLKLENPTLMNMINSPSIKIEKDMIVKKTDHD